MANTDRYDELFAETTPEESVFVDKSALNPLESPEEVIGREKQERELAGILNGISEGYLPPTISIYGPPGTGKTITTRRLCTAFADRHDDFAVEYVNLKECRTLFSVGNEILFELAGEKKQAYEGLDGIFGAIWEALEEYPEWTVLLLDEIDHIRHDSNYDPNEFFYRLLRGEGRLKRDIGLSVWLLSNELLEVELRVDSRVKSAMSDEAVFFPHYDADGLREILEPRLARAFTADALSAEVIEHGVTEAANRWGDVRKALTLFRHAGETANERGLSEVTIECLDASIETADNEAVINKLLDLPLNHFVALSGVTDWGNSQSGIKHPVTTAEVRKSVQKIESIVEIEISDRAFRDIITDLETMGLVETWIDSRGGKGRVKQIQTTFEPTLVHEALRDYVKNSKDLQSITIED
ncbi:Cdc6/Cdc18 family protein [Haloferacaceae archaeon DSL9]